MLACYPYCFGDSCDIKERNNCLKKVCLLLVVEKVCIVTMTTGGYLKRVLTRYFSQCLFVCLFVSNIKGKDF